MNRDLRDLLHAWLADELDESRMPHLLTRLESDREFREAFVAEIVMLGKLKALQPEPSISIQPRRRPRRRGPTILAGGALRPQPAGSRTLV